MIIQFPSFLLIVMSISWSAHPNKPSIPADFLLLRTESIKHVAEFFSLHSWCRKYNIVLSKSEQPLVGSLHKRSFLSCAKEFVSVTLGSRNFALFRIIPARIDSYRSVPISCLNCLPVKEDLTGTKMWQASPTKGIKSNRSLQCSNGFHDCIGKINTGWEFMG